MKTVYTLAWEEFKEIYGDSWPRPDYFSAIAIAIVALPLIGYGTGLLLLGSLGPDNFVAYMFVGAPLFLLLAAVATLKPQWKKAMALAVTEKRLEYERWFSQEQSFSFDHERWIHEAATGRQEVPWPSLVNAVEYPSIWYLIGENSSVVVPKRTLDQASIDVLHQLAFPVGSQTWPLQISVWDYQAARTAWLWRKYWFLMALGNISGVGVLLWVLHLWLTTNEKIGVVWGWILASFAVVLVLAAQLWYFPLRYATSSRNWRTAKAMALSGRGIYLETSYVGHFTAWKSFFWFEEIGRVFLLYLDAEHRYIVSKRYLSPEQQVELRGYLKNLKRR